MRKTLAISMLAMLAAAGCASRGDLRALQAPEPAPRGVLRFDDGHELRGAVALEWVGGVSRQSYLFAEPNQRIIRPVLQDALAESGLAAGTTVRARYGLRVDVAEVDGPTVGADYDSEVVATYVMVDRRDGGEIWRREVRTPGTGYFLTFNESDWQTAWFVDPILAVYNVANPFNYVAFASDSAADRIRRADDATDRERRQSVVAGGHNGAMAERFGPARAARANHAAIATNVQAFLVAFASDNNVEMIPILPCWGSPEIEARKVEIMASGGEYVTDNCRVRR